MYPINLMLEGRRCLVVGGGTVAERKVTSLLAAGAAVTVIAPAVTIQLRQWWMQGRLEWLCRAFEISDVAGYFLVICATSDSAANAAAAAAGRSGSVLVNVVDQPALCNFTVPSVFCQGDLVLTASTNGKAPAMSRWFRQHWQTAYGEGYGQWLDFLGLFRLAVQRQVPSAQERQIFWRNALSDQVMDLVGLGLLAEAESVMEQALADFIRRQSK